MKKQILLLVSILIVALQMNNAQTYEIYKSQVEYEDQMRPSIKATIQPEAKTLKKAWDDYMDDQFNVNVKGIGFLVNREVLSSEDIVLPTLSEKKIDLYVQVLRKEGNTQMDVFGAFKNGEYIGENHETAYNALHQLTKSFLSDFLTSYYQEQYESSKEELTDVQDDVNDLEEDITKAQKDIEKHKEKIESLNKDIDKKKKQLADLKKKLSDRLDTTEEKKEELDRIRKKLQTIEE